MSEVPALTALLELRHRQDRLEYWRAVLARGALGLVAALIIGGLITRHWLQGLVMAALVGGTCGLICHALLLIRDRYEERAFTLYVQFRKQWIRSLAEQLTGADASDAEAEAIYGARAALNAVGRSADEYVYKARRQGDGWHVFAWHIGLCDDGKPLYLEGGFASVDLDAGGRVLQVCPPAVREGERRAGGEIPLRASQSAEQASDDSLRTS